MYIHPKSCLFGINRNIAALYVVAVSCLRHVPSVSLPDTSIGLTGSHFCSSVPVRYSR